MSVETPTNHSRLALSVLVLAVLVFMAIIAGVASLDQIVKVRYSVDDSKIRWRQALIEDIFGDAKEDRQECDEEVKRSALVTFGKIEELFRQDGSVEERRDREIDTVLQPYRECLERRIKARQQKYKSANPLSSKDI